MAITRLQQARQMYALGQLVSKTMDGSRPGYRGGKDASQDDFSSPSADTGNTDGGTGAVDTGDLGTEEANVAANVSANMDSRDRARMNQYKNLPTPTITVGVDKFGNPINVPTTYTAKRDRQRAIDALNQKGISVFDPRVTKTLNPFDMSLVAQPKQNPFNLKNIAKNVLLSVVAPQLLGKNFATGMKAFNTAKTLSKLAQDINLTDKNVLDSFVNSLTDKVTNVNLGTKSTKSTKDDDFSTDGNGDGIGTLENIDALNQEYLLLLKKFNSGVFSDADQVRFTFLKNILKK